MTPSLSAIREQVLRHIRPRPSDIRREQRCFSRIQKAVLSVAKQKQLEVSFVQLEGSSGRKQTQLRGHRDLDIFIGLPLSLVPGGVDQPPSQTALQQLLRKLVKEVAVTAAEQAGCRNISVVFAQHPYVTATLEGFRVDLVFCFDLPPDYIMKQGPLTAVDRTPHHSRFVDENLTAEQRDDVRLLKAFFQACFAYGDASPVGRCGFTGFSAETLIYHTETLEGALSSLKQLSSTPLDYFGRPAKELKKLFRNDLLIIVDPTDPKRNLAASISGRAYRYVKHQAELALHDPSPRFFLPTDIPTFSAREERRLGPNFFVAEYRDETGWHYTKTRDKLYKYFGQLCRFLSKEPTGEKRFGHCLFEEILDEEEGLFAVALWVEHHSISPHYIRIGPPPRMLEASRRFCEKYPHAEIRDGRYQALIPRTFTRASEAIEHYLAAHPVSPNLRLIATSHVGTTKLGKQALWILKNAVMPFSKAC